MFPSFKPSMKDLNEWIIFAADPFVYRLPPQSVFADWQLIIPHFCCI